MMKIGFVNFNQEEKSKVYKVLQLLRDHRAIDELGISRLRDAFSNKMFSGMSTLQGHAKYFVLLPSLYYQAQKKRYRNLQEVRDEIRRMEINLTQQLINGTPQEIRVGITGSDAIEEALRDNSKYVKYDPTYIYQNGMITYGMIKPQGNLYAAILEKSKMYADSARKFRSRPEDDEAGDSDDLSGCREYFATCGEKYDFSNSTDKISLELSSREARYIKSHIEQNTKSLLSYILTNELPIQATESDNINKDVFTQYELLNTLWKDCGMPSEILEPYRLSLDFSRFVYLLRIVYEWIYTERTEDDDYLEEIKKKWEGCINDPSFQHAAKVETISYIIDYFREEVSEASIIRFCKEGAERLTAYIQSPSPATLQNIMSLVINREKSVKGIKRSKLLHPEEYRGVRHGLASPLAYRWEIVSIMINEIRKGLNNGK